MISNHIRLRCLLDLFKETWVVLIVLEVRGKAYKFFDQGITLQLILGDGIFLDRQADEANQEDLLLHWEISVMAQ